MPLIAQKQNSIGRTGFVEALPNVQPTTITEWDSAAKNYKLYEETITYVNGIATLAVAKSYLRSGAIVETLTETPAYTGGLLDNVTPVLT